MCEDAKAWVCWAVLERLVWDLNTHSAILLRYDEVSLLFMQCFLQCPGGGCCQPNIRPANIRVSPSRCAAISSAGSLARMTSLLWSHLTRHSQWRRQAGAYLRSQSMDIFPASNAIFLLDEPPRLSRNSKRSQTNKWSNKKKKLLASM